MSERSEQLNEVKKALGRFYGRMEGRPTKTESRMYESAAEILTQMIGDEAPQPTTTADPQPQEDEQGEGQDDLGSMTVEEVKRRVNSGDLSVDEALEAEQAGKNRSTLVSWLNEQKEDQS